MSWRLARSLDTLRAETRRRWPGTTVWTIGDAAHASRASDHNPNSRGVVCAIDVVGRPQAQAIYDHLMRTRDPRVKYLIFDRRIVNSTVSPWTPRPYGGENPHTTHIHVSVGRGPSGRSTHPNLYDDPAPWGLVGAPPPVEEDVMTPEQDARLKAIEQAVAQLAGSIGGLTSRVATIEGWNSTERRLDVDANRLRLSVRQIADKLGLPTEHEPPDGPVGA